MRCKDLRRDIIFEEFERSQEWDKAVAGARLMGDFFQQKHIGVSGPLEKCDLLFENLQSLDF